MINPYESPGDALEHRPGPWLRDAALTVGVLLLGIVVLGLVFAAFPLWWAVMAVVLCVACKHGHRLDKYDRVFLLTGPLAIGTWTWIAIRVTRGDYGPLNMLFP
jgi:hypothetical protein